MEDSCYFFSYLSVAWLCGLCHRTDRHFSNPDTIAKGDLTVKVNGNGKAAYANDAKLAFGTAGKIEQLPVNKWDTVR